MQQLTEAQLAEALGRLPEWRMQNGKLHREYRFPDFAHAFGFMAACAPSIEARNHHPEWWNAYGRVIVDLTTHDAGGVTAKDTGLAELLETMARKLLA
ncbi:MAG: 4a-hydroxytetrahydrobiopterin dehydratase [Bryobacteraceae bacterium]